MARAETRGNMLSLLTWVIFGAAFVGSQLGALDWRVVSDALLSLTLIRMLPVSLSLLGLGIRPDAQLFLGWFGPRGLASIVFAVIVMGENLAGGKILSATVICTVTLSTLPYGMVQIELTSTQRRASQAVSTKETSWPVREEAQRPVAA